MIYIHEVLLTGEDDFSKRFNYVSKLYALAKQDEEKWANEYINSKLALEQGFPIIELELPI